ncbi:MAG: MotA/TolQ/ExbB proton channel family protein [Puniceicoccales bacterium]|nr:MotA/TolQ/ExbB proton channel family protein [Puniceicoccales bacterium]
MNTLVEGAGHFIWPLGFCSFLAAFIAIERLIALRPGNIMPEAVTALLARGDLSSPLPRRDGDTLGGRLVHFCKKNNPDTETFKAYAQMELSQLERGLFLLDTIVSVAPLIGLLGTVYGLFMLFPEKGLPNTATLTHGIGLALTTTILGLLVAIPALICSNYIARRLEVISARVNLAVERLLALLPPAPPPP